MSQSDQKSNAYKNESGKALPIVLAIVLLLIIGAWIVSSQTDILKDNQFGSTEPVANVETVETAIETVENVDISDDAVKAIVKEGVEVAVSEVVEEKAMPLKTDHVTLDTESLGTPRIMGNTDAAVKISEHSSFTCGGCALFHSGNFKSIKKDYIDTGKAYLVFDDFPRNQYDILIGAAARCVPEQSYFNFVQLLFETQKEWLNEDYMTYIKQNAVLAGADKDTLDSCIENEELQETLANRQDNANKTHGVNSTPTLIINDTVKIGGLDKYSNIKKAIDAALGAAEK